MKKAPATIIRRYLERVALEFDTETGPAVIRVDTITGVFVNPLGYVVIQTKGDTDDVHRGFPTLYPREWRNQVLADIESALLWEKEQAAK